MHDDPLVPEPPEAPLTPSAETATGSVMIRCPCCNAEFSVAPLPVAGSNKTPVENAVDAVRLTDADPPPSADAAPFSITVDGAEGSQPTGLATGRSASRGIFREMVQIVVGGIVGLTIAYYGLNFFGGQQFDYLHVYLPGVAHTAVHRPQWWPGSSPSGCEDDTVEDESAW